MKKNNNEELLDCLYELREGKVEKSYKAKYGETGNEEKTQKAEEELVEFMKKFIKDEKDITELYGKINKFELCESWEMCFWLRPYYKVGFLDGIKFKNEIRKKSEEFENNNSYESIIYQNFNEITDYFESKKYNNLKENKEYQKIAKDIEEIKTKFPRIRDFLDNDKITEFSKEESKAILQIISLYADRAMYEADEMLKIGIKEGKAL